LKSDRNENVSEPIRSKTFALLFSFETRVTRLGEFSPIGWLFTLGSFLKMTEVAQIFGLLFPNVSATYVLILTESGLGNSWASFSQTHLVTLFETLKISSVRVIFFSFVSTRVTRVRAIFFAYWATFTLPLAVFWKKI
jgi:hypothetical protein